MTDPKEPTPPPPPSKGLDGLQLFFLVAACVGGFLSMRSPATNLAQAIFRAAVVAVGAIGLLVVSLIKYNRSRHGG
ncbi:MAG TPA: hypothetical protein VGF55_16680 [Gemmataceae bacterium]|jgi:hypothetical protein